MPSQKVFDVYKMKYSFWPVFYSIYFMCLFSQLHFIGALYQPNPFIHKISHSHYGHRQSKRNTAFTISSIDSSSHHYSNSYRDFDLLFESVINYKKIFGSLFISKKFTVPQDSNWPPQLRGFRLGKQLEEISNDKSFKENFTCEYETLCDLGIDFEKRKTGQFELLDDWQILVFALRQYKALYGDLNIDSYFKIPVNDPLWNKFIWGWPLGNRVSIMRRKVLSLCERAELDSIGFVWNAPKPLSKRDDFETQIFNRFCDVFKLIGNVSDYDSHLLPAELINFPFKTALSEILTKGRFLVSHKNVEKLCDLNFDWGCELPWKEYSVLLDDLFRAILLYEDRFKTLHIPKQFSLPMAGNWPASCRGMNLFDLYQYAISFSSNKNIHLIRAALQSFPIVWQNETHVSEEDQGDSLSIKDRIGASEFVSANFPTEERVPFHSRSRYPLDTTFMFENIKYREYAASQIIRHKTEKMHVNSPKRFSAYFDWDLSPHQVGQLLAIKIPAEERSRVERLGYRFIEFGQYSWEAFLFAIEKFKQHYGHLAVPIDYKISPANFAVFNNESVAGMELGLFCQALRNGDFDGYEDLNRRKVLDELGFEWGDMKSHLRFRFFPFIYALRIQHQMGGFNLGGPSFDFVVSDDLPYFPFWLQKAPVGRWYQIAKFQRPVLEKYFPDRLEILNTFDFQWWWPFPEEFISTAQQFANDL